MAHKSTFKLQFRRRREGRTNYRKRLALLSSKLPRLVVRKTNTHIIAQIVEYEPKGDKTVVHVNSSQLQSFGWKASKKNLPAAYLTGLLIGVKARKGKIEQAVLDIGNNTPIHGAFWTAVLKGALEAGLKVSSGEEALPSQERASGKHIALFAEKLGQKAGEKFSGYAKEKLDPKQIEKIFNEAKEKILREKDGGGEVNE
ncbi:MAG: 50S ribosomal protein L18 [Candidatus Diapherotrites archaeon]|uniref:Large ribosomal subunit protein uL18 n=1 Tax=Candidatus Iainarchaeum sp. TaxID=3101447 RepID=A0A939C8F3_9ARCH|nr:50S ribosomal protein L18 [Candidatus Diapherotrites archaeon]